MADDNEINHVLYILDGHRRFASREGVHPVEAYKQTVDILGDEIIPFFCSEEIPLVSLYLLAKYNFERPSEELDGIFKAADYAVDVFLNNRNVNYNICGDLSNFPYELSKGLSMVGEQKNSSRTTVNLMIGYSGEVDRAYAIKQCLLEKIDLGEKDLLGFSMLGRKPIDVIIRTGGVVRLSDGPTIGISQSRMYAIDKYAPETTAEDLASVLDDFRTGTRI